MVGTRKSYPKLRPDSKSEEQEHGKPVDYDTFLSAAGEFGLYQWIMFFSTCPFYIFGAITYFSQIFMTEPSPNHWCWIPELQNLTEIERRNLAIPTDNSSRFGYSQCQSYYANWTHVINAGIKPNETWSTISCQNGWEFNRTEIPYPTTSSEFDWVCDKRSYQATAQSIFFVGSIVGGLIIGWIADRFGRLPAATCSNMISCIGGIGTAYARNFMEFTICRFFVGMGYDNCMMMTYLLILEYSAPRYRSIIGNMPFATFFTIGATSLPWIALACGNWRTLALVTSIPMAASLFAPFLLPESPRWLLSKGRVDETVNKVLTIARVNKKKINPKIVEQFKISNKENTNLKESASILKMLQSSPLRKLFICISLNYMFLMIVFDVSTRTLGILEFDFFLSFTLVSVTEFPSLAIISFIMDLTGRRWLTIATMTVCSIFTILTAFMSGVGSVTCAVITRFTVNMAANTALQWCAELLPTPVRGSGVAFVHICGYVATVISPFIAYLDVVASWLPFVVIGCVAASCTVLAFILPETANKEMPQTFEASEDLMRNKQFWDFPSRKKASNCINGQVNESFEMTS